MFMRTLGEANIYSLADFNTSQRRARPSTTASDPAFLPSSAFIRFNT
jgi:hypothetical protein